MSSCHPAFVLVAERSYPALGIQAFHYRHQLTGAVHYHLAADHSEQVFLVALRTMPMDSTGVAHILEHTSLCGSERFPVRDPFFAMTRRSLNTFMNAFTAPDWTAYPFASENAQDFDNLLSVYLDAVFFPQLNYLDFRQEGHRLEWQESADPGQRLTRQGVVYNEMKGAMSSALARMWQRISGELFSAQSTYHHNSGGEPSDIGQLSHSQLVDFHRQHYHPSNAVFMTFGDQDPLLLQQRIEQQALARFAELGQCFSVPLAVPQGSKRAQMRYPASEEELAEGGKLALAWLWPESTSIRELLTARLLNDLLLDHSGSPLRHLLETSSFAQAPLGLCGLDDSCKQMMFIAGFDAVPEEQMAVAEQSILDCLHQVATQGFAAEDVQAALHQLELQQREISGDGYPYGLQLMLQSLPAAIHQGDVLGMLDLNAELEWLATQAQQPDWLVSKLREWLLNNPECLVLQALPDAGLQAEERQAEQAELAQLETQLSATDIAQIVQEQQQLTERQNQQDDFSLLPKVSANDVRAQLRQRQPSLQEPGLSFYQAGTNGIFYQSWVQSLKQAPVDWSLLPLYSALVTELGTGDLDYLQAQQRQNADLGGLSLQLQYRAHESHADELSLYLSLSGKSLTSKALALSDWQRSYLEQPRFDEHQRVQELCTQIRLRKQQGITQSGHSLMMSAASRVFSPVAGLMHQWSGVQSVLDSRDWPTDPEQIAARMQSLHTQLMQGSGHWLQIADQSQPVRAPWPRATEPLSASWLSLPTQSVQAVRELWTTNSSVNFCARAYSAAPLAHVDTAALWVLAAYLRNGFLHRVLREQGGAYGGGASFDPMSAVFRFYSYRDVRTQATFDDFAASLQWLQRQPVEAQTLDEAILSVVSSMDRPHSPAGAAKSAFWQQAFGRTLVKRQQLLASVLAVTGNDLLRVAETWLLDRPYQDAILTSEEHRLPLEKEGFVWQQSL